MYLMKGDKEMAVINVVGDYSISIDNNGDHEARRFVKMNKMVDKTTGEEKEIPYYDSIGHYSNVANALYGVKEDMCLKKANKKESITVKEWIDIIKEVDGELKDIIKTANAKG